MLKLADIMNITDSLPAEAPIQRAQNLPPSGEPGDMYGDAGMSSPPPAPVLQNCRSENDNGRISDFSQEPAPVSKEPPAAEMNNQAHQEVVLSLGKMDINPTLCLINAALLR